MKNSRLSSFVRSLGFVVLGVSLTTAAALFLFRHEIYERLTDSSSIYSGSYSNEQYGFSFGNFPEGWALEPVEDSSLGAPVVAEFRLEGVIHEDVSFKIYVAEAEPELSDLVYLGRYERYYFYYSFLHFPFECDEYLAPNEYETRGQCEAVEAVWTMLEDGVLPSFSVKEVGVNY